MFDNVYWHHTNRAMMAMLLRAVQEARCGRRARPTDLSTQDDASLLALLATPAMPEATRDLVDALRLRRPYKVLLEVSGRAGSGLSSARRALLGPAEAPPCRDRAGGCAERGAGEGLEAEIAPHELLVDVPKPEKWEMDVLVRFSRPPLGMARQMTWTEATGQRPSDLGVYEQHQRRIRIVASERVRELVGDRAEALLLPALERVPAI